MSLLDQALDADEALRRDTAHMLDRIAKRLDDLTYVAPELRDERLRMYTSELRAIAAALIGGKPDAG